MKGFDPQRSLLFYAGVKNRENNQTMIDMEIKEKMKLATRNWLTTALFPPDRSVTSGTAVTGGMALSKRISRAI